MEGRGRNRREVIADRFPESSRLGLMRGSRLLRAVAGLMFVDLVGFIFGSAVAVVVALMMLLVVLRGERWTGEEREKQCHRQDSLHGADVSTSAIPAKGRSSIRHQKMNGATTRLTDVKRADGDDGGGGDGGAAQMRAPDLRASTSIKLPQESFS